MEGCFKFLNISNFCCVKEDISGSRRIVSCGRKVANIFSSRDGDREKSLRLLIANPICFKVSKKRSFCLRLYGKLGRSLLTVSMSSGKWKAGWFRVGCGVGLGSELCFGAGEGCASLSGSEIGGV